MVMTRVQDTNQYGYRWNVIVMVLDVKLSNDVVR
jgi:hypothetical protein